jgi:hypothetical protein
MIAGLLMLGVNVPGTNGERDGDLGSPSRATRASAAAAWLTKADAWSTIAAMLRRSTLLSLLALCSLVVGCRADEADCRELARHISELAEAEGKGGAGTTVALEQTCKEQRPSRALVECMMAAEDLAAVNDC